MLEVRSVANRALSERQRDAAVAWVAGGGGSAPPAGAERLGVLLARLEAHCEAAAERLAQPGSAGGSAATGSGMVVWDKGRDALRAERRLAAERLRALEERCARGPAPVAAARRAPEAAAALRREEQMRRVRRWAEAQREGREV
ncbi:unnamed protein product [Prorocentrum cordatum]|uniref:Uncharacterized protein n=1 Tax=Prorocentrum cordatum TaxID=2364126 RepID=A0ABN9Q073_9DINO|nr:unnamed protein product [Polarella glacialis]